MQSGCRTKSVLIRIESGTGLHPVLALNPLLLDSSFGRKIHVRHIAKAENSSRQNFKTAHVTMLVETRVGLETVGGPAHKIERTLHLQFAC